MYIKRVIMTDVLGKDIKMSDGDIQFSTSQDFTIASGNENFAQAIENRLKTIQGEYFNNPLYGSRISNTFGKSRSEITKNEIKGYVIEALRQEPRVNDVDSVNIEFEGDRTIIITLNIQPIGTNTYLNLIYPLFIEA